MYCEDMCWRTDSVVGCDCLDGVGTTELPTVVFLSPAIGLIIVGIFTFFTSILGCAGAIRERNVMLSFYICCITLVIILQFSFGVAAASVASGDSSAIEGPLHAVLKKNYQEFDWMSLDLFFPAACYQGSKCSSPPSPPSPPHSPDPSILPFQATLNFLCKTKSKWCTPRSRSFHHPVHRARLARPA